MSPKASRATSQKICHGVGGAAGEAGADGDAGAWGEGVEMVVAEFGFMALTRIGRMGRMSAKEE